MSSFSLHINLNPFPVAVLADQAQAERLTWAKTPAVYKSPGKTLAEKNEEPAALCFAWLCRAKGERRWAHESSGHS